MTEKIRRGKTCEECQTEGPHCFNCEPPAASAGYSFRLLTERDVICKTDEFLEDDCQTWSPMTETPIFIGMIYNKTVFVPIRRKL
jgi:hypothetical protein